MKEESKEEIGFWQATLNIVALIVFGTLLIALKAYVILSLAKLYEIAIIVQMPFLQVLGLLGIISLFLYKDRKKTDGETTKEQINDAWLSLYKKAMYILLCWGVGFAIFGIF